MFFCIPLAGVTTCDVIRAEEIPAEDCAVQWNSRFKCQLEASRGYRSYQQGADYEMDTDCEAAHCRQRQTVRGLNAVVGRFSGQFMKTCFVLKKF